ncbi:MAG: ribonuclease J, partial [Bacilli bacterium]|nr:ribonuclease J [Bacilli bacterium]
MNQTISSGVSIYALGGLGEVGKNMYVLESDSTIIIIDSGVMFPGSEMPGVDYVIPDYTHLKNNRGKIRALFITHGHEDHIGGIPFLIQTVHIPVIYAPKLAAALIKHKLEDMRIKEPVKIIEYDSDSVLLVDIFKVSFFRVTHSIPDAYGLCVDTPDGRIVHTGDFKIDLTPVGPDIELDKIARIGSEGVDLLLSDSTNAEIEGYTQSETSIIAGINEIYGKADGRLIISTFSSNISRIQQLVEAAVRHNRKIAIVGRSMENAVSTSRAMGYIKLTDDNIVDLDNIQNYRANELCILCTGSQGEPMAALARIANGEHKSLRIFPGDTVVFSSSVIPGNGVLIDKIVNQLVRRGANVLTNSILLNIHSSGHPAKQELRLMLKLINPRYFMPIHG